MPSFPLDGNNAPAVIRQASRPTGTQTGPQYRSVSLNASIPGYRFLAMPGTYITYRRILSNPTVALTYAATRALSKTPDWSVEADDDVPDDVVKFLEDTFVKDKARILNHAVTAYVFGRCTFEKVWERKAGRLAPKLKPLVPDITTPMIDEDTGVLVGVKNDEYSGEGSFLPLTKCWHYAYDGEAEDPYGRSRLENIRTTAWRAWEDTREKMAQYTTKAAGVVPVAHMPIASGGTGVDEDGSEDAMHEFAERLLRDLGSGKGIVMPDFPPSDALLNALGNFPGLADSFRWRISFLEVQSGHGAEFLDMLKQEETRMVRGMLWPERAILEGQFGTKAEAGAHQDIGITICEQDLQELVEAFNRDVVDDALAANWGTTYIGKVRIRVAPMRDTEREFFRGLMKDLLMNPVALETAAQIIDLDAHLDQAGFTKATEIVTMPGLMPGAVPSVQPTPEQAANVANAFRDTPGKLGAQ